MTITCVEPFRKIEIHENGHVTICCYSWLPKVCGNLLTDSFEQILTNATRQEILSDMRLGKFTHCREKVCPHLSYFNNTNEIPIVFVDSQLVDLNNQYRIYLSYDKSCNLQCGSCRNELILNKLSDKNSELIKIHNESKKLIESLLKSGKDVLVNITGSGDPFASPLYNSYLNELSNAPITNQSNLKIKLMTNGLLMTETMWESLAPLLKNIHSINIGIDAANDKTYSVVRKNGNFTKLKNNLKLLDEMILSKHFSKSFQWNLTYVVQQQNYKEIKDFMTFRNLFKSKPNVYFSLIDKWGHFTDETFNIVCLTKNQKIELKEMLTDPVFTGSGIDLGNLNSL